MASPGSLLVTLSTPRSDKFAIKGLPPDEGADGVYLPGERGFEAMSWGSLAGIPVVRGTLTRLATLAAKLNVAVPGDCGP
jgi:LDH2 family malate/lactate/ureidoglycolate dehydrogenase